MIQFLKMLKILVGEDIIFSYNVVSPFTVAEAIGFNLHSVPGTYLNDNPNPFFIDWFGRLISIHGGDYCFSPYIGGASSESDSDETKYKMFIYSLFTTYGRMYDAFSVKYDLNVKLLNKIRQNITGNDFFNNDDFFDDIENSEDVHERTNEIFPDETRITESPNDKIKIKNKTTRTFKTNYNKIMRVYDTIDLYFFDEFMKKFDIFFTISDYDD